MLQAASSYQVQLIQHSYRHADLRVYTFRAGDSSSAIAHYAALPETLDRLTASGAQDPTYDTEDSDVTDSSSESGMQLSRPVQPAHSHGQILAAQAAFSVDSKQALSNMPKLHPATMLTPQQVSKLQ